MTSLDDQVRAIERDCRERRDRAEPRGVLDQPLWTPDMPAAADPSEEARAEAIRKAFAHTGRVSRDEANVARLKATVGRITDDWERKFVESVAEQVLDDGRDLTAKQRPVVDRILRKMRDDERAGEVEKR